VTADALLHLLVAVLTPHDDANGLRHHEPPIT
jgi:hypothetical protein